jgi:polysaccharide export outer membrane protein
MVNRYAAIRLVVTMGVFLMPVTAISQSTDVTAGSRSAVTTYNYSYLLGPSDVVHVEALNHPDFNVRTTIGADGTIQLPYIGTVPAANTTVSTLRRRIVDELLRKGVFSNASIAVDVVSFASRYVTVLGGVASPGLVSVDRAYHLSEILARAGGPREGSSNYIILRSGTGPERRLAIKDLATGGENLDPFVSPGDKIYVPTEVFYITGQVKSPGSYSLSLNMTLAMALARGGGLTDTGSDSRIKVTRKGVQVDPHDLNFRIMPDDVIDVGEGWF